MSVYGVGLSALAAAQAGISVTGNNIANASTPGYSRETVQVAQQASQRSGNGYFGQGVVVADIKRSFNAVLVSQRSDAQSSSSSLQTYANQMSAVENILSDSNAGLTPALQSFFSSLNGLSADPSSTAQRQTVVSNANTLADRFKSISNSFKAAQASVNSQISGITSTINTLTASIASLNFQISQAKSSTGSAPNSLLDERDNAVLELNKSIKATVQDDGTNYTVSVGSGIPLVVSNNSYKLTPVNSSTQSGRVDVGYQPVGSGVTIPLQSSNITGGTLGGLLQFREQSLDPAENQLGQIATAVATSLNKQSLLGTDLQGAAGTNMFSIAAPATYPNTNNTGSANISVTVANGSAITDQDYTLAYDGTKYNITRSSDNAVVSSTTSLPQTVDGLTFAVSSGSMNLNDSFLVRPTQNAASSMQALISDPTKIAAGGTPFVGPGDGTNALNMLALQTQNLVGGKSSFNDAFSRLVSGVGVKTNELNVTSASQNVTLGSLNDAVQSESGVNLDEESTNLIRYQQAYQAAAKLISTANTIFDTILNMRQ